MIYIYIKFSFSVVVGFQVVSDVLEALIGGILTVGGEGPAMRVIEKMGLPISKLTEVSRAREEHLIREFQWPWKFALGNPWYEHVQASPLYCQMVYNVFVFRSSKLLGIDPLFSPPVSHVDMYFALY